MHPRCTAVVCRFFIAALFIISAPLCALSCGDSAGDLAHSDGKAPYGQFEKTTTYSYSGSLGSGLSDAAMNVELIGQTTINGKTYNQHRIGLDDLEETANGTFTMNVGSDSVEVIAAELNAADYVAVTGLPYLSFGLDTPVTAQMFPPKGKTVHVETSGDFVMGDPAVASNHHQEDVAIDYTTTDDDAALETALGVLHGVHKVELETNLAGQDVNADIWIHPELGVLKAFVDYPAPDGITLDMVGTMDYGDPDAEWNAIRSMQVLDGDNGVYKLDTYDAAGELDADKDTHAKMLLELRWADADVAATDREPGYPGVIIDFGTLWGTYPFVLTQSPVSLFHPEENGKGYTYWYAFVDQAAKNESINGISYHITVTADTDINPALRVTGRIIYKRYKE